jgi:hypothetical protein
MGNDIFWQVTAVFDPDGTGQDFAYTVGLGDRGLPELHMWARPTHGDDVGADFKLSHTDMGHLLNQFAAEWVAGDLHAGDSRPIEVDGGVTTLTFTVGDPVPKRELEAYMATEDTVAPMRWSLSRPAVGEDPGLDNSAAQAWSALLGELRQDTVEVEGVRALPSKDSFDTDQEFGPLTSWVLLLAHRMAAAEAVAVVEQVMETAGTTHLAAGLGQLSVLARTVGRVEALEKTTRLALSVTEALSQQAQWQELVEDWAAELELPAADLHSRLTQMVTGAAAFGLQTAVLADIPERDLIGRANDAWEGVVGVPPLVPEVDTLSQ